MTARTARGQSAAQTREAAHYLATGDHGDPLFGAWPGQNLIECATNGEHALRTALIDEVRRRTKSKRAPRLPEKDPIAAVRPRLHAMVSGLFAAGVREPALDLLVRSVVFVLPSTIEDVLRTESCLSTAWSLANMYLQSLAAKPLSSNVELDVLGLSSGRHAFVSIRYFTESGRFDDFVVHECAHVLHDTKRREVGLPHTRPVGVTTSICSRSCSTRRDRQPPFAGSSTARSPRSTRRRRVSRCLHVCPFVPRSRSPSRSPWLPLARLRKRQSP